MPRGSFSPPPAPWWRAALAFIAAPPALQAGPAVSDSRIGLAGQSALSLTAILLMAA